MEALEWLNENSLRNYPLLDDVPANGLPESAILDLQLILNSPSNVSGAKLIDITISSVSKDISINFTENSFYYSLIDNNLNTFSDIQFPLYIRNSSGSLLVLGDGLLKIPVNTPTTYNLPVEPATVFEFGGAWLGVRSINQTPNYATNSGDISPALPLTSISGIATAGDVEFIPGYNYQINFDNSLINMTAAYALGLQMDCTTRFLPPQYHDCPDIVSYINGIPPDSDGIFKFVQGNNIYLVDGNSVQQPIQDTNISPPLGSYTDISGNQQTGLNNNTVFVGLTFLESDLCSPVQLLPTNN